jgi:hypothetical protein
VAKTGEKSGTLTVVFERELLQSSAYLSLTGKSTQVLSLFMGRRRLRQDTSRRKRWVITNNGEIEFTYEEAKVKWNLSRSVFKRAVDQLIDRGFIDVSFRGTGLRGSKNLYSISDRWRAWDTDRFEQAKPLPKVNYGGFKKGHVPYGRRPRLSAEITDTHGEL